MKKRVNREALFILTAIVVCFSFVNFICIAFPALKLTHNNEYFNVSAKVEGLIAIVGGTISAGSETNNSNLLNASFNLLSLIGYIIPLVGCILSMIALNKTNQIMYYIAGVFCLAGGVITLFEGVIFTSVNNLKLVEVSLLFGPIIGGICGVLAGVVSFGSWYIFNKK